MILFFVCVIELYKIPLKASFGLVFETGTEFYLLHLSPIIMFVCEMLLNLNVGYY
jgi:hypothetical protein